MTKTSYEIREWNPATQTETVVARELTEREAERRLEAIRAANVGRNRDYMMTEAESQPVTIVAVGDTYGQRKTLRKRGFQWDADNKRWIRQGMTRGQSRYGDWGWLDARGVFAVADDLIDGITYEIAE